MPGGRLVQGQRRQVVQRAAGQVMGVQPIGTRTAPACGPERRNTGRYRHDGEAPARQGADDFPHFAIHAFADPGGIVEQLLRGLGVELRVAAQEAQEVGKARLRRAAFEPHLVDDRVHLGMDGCNFLQADGMNFIGR